MMAERPGRRPDLSDPGGTSGGVRIRVDAESVGRSAESIARFFGTTRYLVIQTVIVIVWIILNVAVVSMRWDPYPFILLNLAFSTQAAYAAPLILLAQNRQEARDKVSLEDDRSRAVAAKADTEFIARELASLRLAMGEVATRDFVRSELQRMLADSTPDETPKKGKGAKKKSTDGSLRSGPT
ncbi:DUF1003 domain-containing protein [Cumulibacter manganitolerans]|uniref:DUF1003 domain-containing protein n=1 Tax=Cumulibacter manganitolerans TaxID=1884992 RepID=UPI001E354AE2|nr:DUF1003 domain-containing protein [Cumulibacter manganitolerans]